MATGDLSESALKSSIDSSKKKQLEALASGGQAGLTAYEEADTQTTALETAASRDIMRLAGKDNAAAVAELQAAREALLGGAESAAELGRQGFADQSARLKQNVEDFATTFKNQAPAYARIENEYRSQAAARRLAAKKKAQEKAFKSARDAAIAAAEFSAKYPDVETNLLNRDTSALVTYLEDQNVNPVVKGVINELINHASPLKMNTVVLNYIGNPTMFNEQNAQAIVLAINQMDPTVDAGAVLEQINDIRATFVPNSASPLVDPNLEGETSQNPVR